MSEKKLTDKEENFCQAYVNDPDPKIRWNKTQSAIKAGYSEHSARALAYETYTKPYIKARISELCEEKRKTDGELRDQVVDEFQKLAMKDDIDQYKVAGLTGLAKYLGMDKQNLDITSGGEKLPTKIVIQGVSKDE